MIHQKFTFSNADIDRAFAERQFSLAFQPKVLLRTGAICGAEAFMRWRHPDFGLIPPSAFLAYLESQDRIGELTRHALKEAAKACNVWRKTGQHWDVSINLSIDDFHHSDLAPDVEDILATHGLPPSMLTLELPQAITYLGPDRRQDGEDFGGPDRRQDAETAKIWNRVLDTVYGLKSKGVRISLDGGGNALAAIEMFEPQPFTEIKVGGDAIVQISMTETAPESSVTPAHMRFALEMGISTVAVGIEDAATLRAVRQAGFTTAQGSFIGRPVPALSLLEWRPTHLREVIDAAALAARPRDVMPPREADAARRAMAMRKKTFH